MKSIDGMPPAVEYEPIRCKGAACGCVLNPFCQVDFGTKMWTCPFCLNRNHFPPHYAANISETQLPAELIPQFTTLEYQLPSKTAGPPVFMFVVDTCVDDEELDELKDSLQQSLNLLPDESLVGFITFGTMVHVHELGFADCPKSYVFQGAKDYEATRVQELLGLGGHAGVRGRGAGGPSAATMAAATSRFLLPVSECSLVLENILEDLQRDPWPRATGRRPARATGVALSIAVSLLQRTVGWQGARIMSFLGGPCTHGPGTVADPEVGTPMRSHTDLQKGNAPFHKPASAFYAELAKRCVSSSHVIDIFACALDQIGLLEMQPLVESTGGLCVLADTFSQSVFKESFKRVFARFEDDAPPCDAGHLTMGFAATLEVLCSREFKVSGAIGPCSSMRKAGPQVGETEIGEGGTCAWSMGGINPTTAVALYFEVANARPEAISHGKRHFLQLVTKYQHSSGRYRIRVTTCSGPWHADPSSNTALAMSFDQEAAAVLMARIAVQRTKTHEIVDIMRWLDRSLIRLCSKFAQYRKDDPASFQLPPQFTYYPSFMFHLRRSQFLQVFNSSPDESAYYRMVLKREDVSNSLTMIQPSLMSYVVNQAPQPALLDSTSVRPDGILVLDTFFHVVVFHGETVAQWRDERYQDDPKYASFKEMLASPQEEAQAIMATRFPVPRYIVCDQHRSQARFLMAKINPSVTHMSGDASGGSGVVFTDDVSLGVFMDHLMKLAVAS